MLSDPMLQLLQRSTNHKLGFEGKRENIEESLRNPIMNLGYSWMQENIPDWQKCKIVTDDQLAFLSQARLK